jgi:hypothetical protein
VANGIEFTIEIMDKIDAAVRASKELDNVMSSAKKADDAVRKYEKSTGMLGKTMASVGGAVKQFGSHLAALAIWDGIKAGANALAEVGKSAFEAAAGAERMEKSFAFMFGKRRGEGILEEADKTAKISQFDDDAQKKARQALLSAGVKDNRLMLLTSAAGDIAGKTGTGQAGFESAIRLFQMIQTTGKAPMARTLAELGLGEGAGKAIEKEMGRGMTAMDAFLTVLQKANGGRAFGAIDEEMAKLADVRFSKLVGLPGQFYQQLSKTEAFEKISGQIGKLLEAFDPDSPRGQRIFKGLETMATKFAEMIAKVDVDKVANRLIRLFEVLPPLIEATTRAVLGLASAMSKVFSGENIEQFQRGWGRAKAIVDAGVSANPAVIGAKGLRAAVNFFTGAGKASADGFASGVPAGLPAVQKSVEAIPETAQQTTEDKLKIRSPSRVFADLGRFVSAGFSMGIDAGMTDVEASMRQFSPEALMPDLIPQARAAAPIVVTASGGGGSMEAHVIVNVTTGGTGGEAAAREVGEAAASGVRQALQSIVEQMAAEGA